MEQLRYDIRQAFRQFRKKPLFTLVIVLTLALGIGCSTAIFSFVHALLLRPLPYKDAGKLVILESIRGGEEGGISLREIRDLLETTTIFEDIAAYVPGAQYNMSGQGDPEELPATLCTSNLFTVLGSDFALGEPWPTAFDTRRSFGIVLTHELWERKYDKDPSILGQSITLDAYNGYQVFGILPQGVTFPFACDLFRSAVISDSYVTDRGAKAYKGLGRLRQGVNLTQARREVERVGLMLSSQYPNTNMGLQLSLTPLSDLYLGNIRPYLYALSGAVFFLLLIACVNVANLLLSHAAGRDKEVGVRSILGAGRRSLIRQFLIESVSLSLMGGILGVGLATLCLYALKDYLQGDMPHWVHINIHTTALLFALLLSVITGILAGLMPALKVTAINIVKVLKEAKGSSGGKHRHRLRKAFVVAQMALGVVLIIAASLMVKSFLALQKVDLGFDPGKKLTFRVSLPWRSYGGQPAKVNVFYQTALARLAAIPGIEGVALNSNPPLSAADNAAISETKDAITLEGQSVEEQAGNPYVNYQFVSSNYFTLLKIPRVSGRLFSEFDKDSTSTQVAIISQSLATKLFGSTNPLGRRIKSGTLDSKSSYRTVVGVVKDVKHDHLTSSAGYDIYVSALQSPYSNQYFIVQTTQTAMQFVEPARRAILAVDGDQSTFDFMSMEDRIDRKLWQSRISGIVFSLLAFLTMMLSGVGIFSVMSYMVSQRTKELGVRRVVGANKAGIFQMILKQVAQLSFWGIVIGISFSFILTRSLESILFGVRILDITTYVLVPLFLTLSAMLAALLPAWRATLINPVTALRTQ